MSKIFKYKTSEGNKLTNITWINNSIDGSQYEEDGWWCVPLKDDVTSIGVRAFNGCNDLTSVEIPDGITAIGDHSFSLSAITFITMPDSVASIGEYAFYSCSFLANVVLPSRLTSMGKVAFGGCPRLTSVEIPDGVTSIEPSTFFECTSLTSATIPGSVTSIKNYAFYGCSNLTSVVCEAKVPPEIEQGNFDACDDDILCVYENSLPDYLDSRWGALFAEIIPIPAPRGYGFTFDEMIDTNYMREV